MMGKFNTDLAAWSVFSLPEIQIVKKAQTIFKNWLQNTDRTHCMTATMQVKGQNNPTPHLT